MYCKRCGATISRSDNYCPSCGVKIENESTSAKEFNIKTDYTSSNIDRGVSLEDELLDIYIGKNADRLKKNSFSLPAFFLGPLYYWYRKMYLEGFIIFAFSIFLKMFLKDALAFDVCLYLYMGFSFKRRYLSHAKKKVSDIIKI